MACSKYGPEDKTEALDRSSDRYGSAAIGCFLECGNEKLYAMVCKHVTNHAEQNFFVGNEPLPRMIARKLETEKKSHQTFHKDVDIIEILDTAKHQIKSIHRNETGKKCEFKLYKGEIEGLFGKTVFHCYRPNGEKDTKVESNSGKAESASTFTDDVSAKSHFVVKGTDGKSFAKPGDSGRIVAREVGGIIELVGIIIWDKINRMDSQQTSEDYSVCMFLPTAIAYLSRKYSMQLILHKTEGDTGKTDEIVEPGQILKFALA